MAAFVFPGNQIGTCRDAVPVGRDAAQRLRLIDAVSFGPATTVFTLEITDGDDALGQPWVLYNDVGTKIAGGVRSDPASSVAVATAPFGIILLKPHDEGPLIVIDRTGLPPKVVSIDIRLAKVDDSLSSDVAAGISTSFASGTAIVTGKGRMLVDDLSSGDLVWTLDHGLQPLNWVGRSEIHCDPLSDAPRPVRIDRHGIAKGYPDSPVWLGPKQGVQISGWRAQMLFGQDELFVPADRLMTFEKVTRDRQIDCIVYFHLLFERPEVILAGGLLCKCTHPAAPEKHAFDSVACLSGQNELRGSAVGNTRHRLPPGFAPSQTVWRQDAN